jgi:hypothetical protein
MLQIVFGLLVIAVVVLGAVGFAFVSMIDGAMNALSRTDLPPYQAPNSPALQPLFFELAGVRYEIRIPQGGRFRTRPDDSDQIDSIEVWHPYTSRLIRMFRLEPAKAENDKTFGRTETLMNGAILQYDIDQPEGGGSGGPEAKLSGRLEIGSKVLEVTCIDQDEMRTLRPDLICLPYLHHLRIANSQ